MSKNRKSLVGSMLALRCPSCRKANLFVNPNTYSFHKLGENKTTCDVCGADLHPEPGFYFGAAYVSYALIVALWVSVLVALKVFDAIGWIEFGFLTHPITFLTTGIAINAIAFPYLFRLSRSIWAHFFIRPEERA
jgi:uncharacterized protein (DUF983 family)